MDQEIQQFSARNWTWIQLCEPGLAVNYKIEPNRTSVRLPFTSPCISPVRGPLCGTVPSFSPVHDPDNKLDGSSIICNLQALKIHETAWYIVTNHQDMRDPCCWRVWAVTCICIEDNTVSCPVHICSVLICTLEILCKYQRKWKLVRVWKQMWDPSYWRARRRCIIVPGITYGQVTAWGLITKWSQWPEIRRHYPICYLHTCNYVTPANLTLRPLSALYA